MIKQFNVEAMNIGEDIIEAGPWNTMVECGLFIPYDGTGYWGTETHFNRSYDAFDKPPAGATHVHWFDK